MVKQTQANRLGFSLSPPAKSLQKQEMESVLWK